MHLEKGFTLAKKYYPLVLLASGIDVLQLGDILRRARGGFHIKFTIPTAVPSLTQLLPDAQQSGGIAVHLPDDFAGGAALLAIALLLLAPYLKGGFLGCVLAGLRGESVDTATFVSSAGRYFWRFVQAFLLTVVVLLLAAPFLIVLAPLAVPIIAILLFYLLFWDYGIVAGDAGIIEAAQASWAMVSANASEVVSFVLPVLGLTAFSSIAANALAAASPVTALLAVGAYGYLGTAVVFAVMSLYLDVAGRR